ncbi:LANO_0E15566g1_1 [Lachancea nothofagi CBS 11611]|uniref:LANO_0E15566g1_1 n=1 Tax=Lachancea nothofagi CBS 11611 TaxID=1266666 RepID=A0A1G4K157_9SACH|nr:LANO_0E15566g1_1 [Lachancea nothofagi CBS 11611]
MVPPLLYKYTSRGLKQDLFRTLAVTFGHAQSVTIKDQEDRLSAPLQAQRLIDLLSDQSNALETRVQATRELSDLVKTLSSETVLNVWNGANDLIRTAAPPNARRAALKLLHVCLERLMPSMSESLRLAFYYNLMDNLAVNSEKCYIIEPELNLFVACLSTLTDYGKKIDTLIKPEDDVLGIDQFLENTLTNIATDDEPAFSSEALLRTLEFVSRCAENGLPINDNFMLQLLRAAHRRDSDEVRRISLYVLVMELGKSPSDSEEVLQGTISLLTGLQSITANLSSQVSPILNVIFQGCNASKLAKLLLVPTTANKNSTGVVNVLTDLLVTKEFEPLWRQSNISAESIGTSLIYFLAEGQCERKASSVEPQEFFLTILLRITKSDEFLVHMRDFPAFWLHPDADPKPTAFNMLSQALKSELSSSNKELVKLIFERVLKLLFAGKHDLLGLRGGAEIFPFLFTFSKYLDSKLTSQLFQYLSQNLTIAVTWDLLPIAIISNFFEIEGSSDVRCESLDLLVKILKEITSQDQYAKESFVKLLRRLISKLKAEKDELVVARLSDLYFESCKVLSSDVVNTINEESIIIAFTRSPNRRRSSLIPMGLSSQASSTWPDYKLLMLADAVTKLSVWSLAYKPEKMFASFYRLLIEIVQYAHRMEHVGLFLTSAKVLTKIYCRGSDQVVMVETTEVEGITTALGKNHKFNPSCEKSKWSFPENVPYLREAQDNAYSGNFTLPKFRSDEPVLNSSNIDIRLWISLGIAALEKPFDWEIYSYLLTYMCPQFASLIPLRSITDLVAKYREIICRHLRQGASLKLKTPKSLHTDDLQVAYIRSLSPLLGYHSRAPKIFADDIVDSLLHAIQGTEKTLVPSLHLLTVCSQEISSSVKRYLTPILVQLQTRITSSFSTPAILEFLLALPHSPLIISHLTLDEFKRVFAIAFKLIQSARDLKKRAQIRNVIQQISYAEQDADFSPSTQSFTISPSIAHFFLTLSYAVIPSWFLRMNSSNRTELAPFVVRNLIAIDADAEEHDFDAHAYLDVVSRFTTSQNDSASIFRALDDRPHGNDEKYSFGKWLLPDKIVSIETERCSGDSTVTIRSCSGVNVFKMQMDHTEAPRTYDVFSISEGQTASAIIANEEKPFYTASYTLMRLGSFEKIPLKVPEDSAVSKSIQLFDKIPFTDFHKIGLIYMGPQQCCETEVLLNTSGSRQYTAFLSRLGQTIKLDNSHKVYTGGLEPEIDGQFALVWRDERTQVVFHTITLMPNNPEDPQFSLKKRHVGNDFVSIFYDESGLPGFDFNMIRSQFNFINIVIKPLGSKPNEQFKVRMYRKSGVPAFFSSSHFKILGGGNLAKYVRQVSIIADIFAASWFASSAPDVCTTWARRAKQLRGINDRMLKYYGEKETQSNPLDFTRYV